MAFGIQLPVASAGDLLREPGAVSGRHQAILPPIPDGDGSRIAQIEPQRAVEPQLQRFVVWTFVP